MRDIVHFIMRAAVTAHTRGGCLGSVEVAVRAWCPQGMIIVAMQPRALC